MMIALWINGYHLMWYHFVVLIIRMNWRAHAYAHAHFLSLYLSVCLFIYLLRMYVLMISLTRSLSLSFSISRKTFSFPWPICMSAQAHFVFTRTYHACHSLATFRFHTSFIYICNAFNYVEHQLTLILNWPSSIILPFIFSRLIFNSFRSTYTYFMGSISQ